MNKIVKSILSKLVVAGILGFVLSACSSGADEVSITVNGVPVLTGDSYEEILNAVNGVDGLLYAELDSGIAVQMPGRYVDSFTVYDELLNSDGTRMFGSQEVWDYISGNNVPSDVVFGLPRHFAATRSDFEDPGKGQVIRGLKLVYERRGKTYETYFVLRTDAS